MGNDRRYKGLLLDEADFALPRDCDMEALTEAVEDYLVAEFSDEFDHPYLIYAFHYISTRKWAFCSFTHGVI